MSSTVADRNEWDLDPSQPKPVPPSVNEKGERILPKIDGVITRKLVTHMDPRGSVTELCDLRWAEVTEPLVYTYVVTIRPGQVKGWSRHHSYADRTVVIAGDIQWVLYDDREDSPTKGMVNSYAFGPEHRVLFTIPRGVWHAARNLSPYDATFINHPTSPYNHKQPDRDLLPLDNEFIPYRFK